MVMRVREARQEEEGANLIDLALGQGVSPARKWPASPRTRHLSWGLESSRAQQLGLAAGGPTPIMWSPS